MKTALVTGASGGIGSEIATELANKGFRVIVHSNTNFDSAKKIADEIGSVAYSCDISDEVAVCDMIDSIEELYGGVDVLVNNAGIALQKMLCDTTQEDWDRIFSVNMKGMFLVTKYAMDSMVKNKFGRIINISSIWGETGGSCEVAYSASKAGVIGFTKALAKELSLSGITVNCITPGVIDTKMNAHLSKEDMKNLADEIPVGRVGKPAEVASLVSYLASDESSYITGQVIGVNGGMNI